MSPHPLMSVTALGPELGTLRPESDHCLYNWSRWVIFLQSSWPWGRVLQPDPDQPPAPGPSGCAPPTRSVLSIKHPFIPSFSTGFMFSWCSQDLLFYKEFTSF